MHQASLEKRYCRALREGFIFCFFFTLYLNFLVLLRPFLLITTSPLQEFSFTQNRSHIRWLETGQISDIM
jgi:hypothetical protein